MQEFLIQRIELPALDEFRRKLSPLIALHLEWIKEESKRHNLTRVPEGDWLVRHVMDSLVPWLAGWDLGESLIDIGTGPGFPGVPLGLQSEELRFALVESKKKVANLLTEFLVREGVSPRGTVQGERIEELAHHPDHRGAYDRVVTRALASLPVLVELGIPYLREKGELWCWKSSISELNEVGKALEELNASVSRILEYNLPGEAAPRFILSFLKHSATSPKYPRKLGIPQKKPLV